MTFMSSSRRGVRVGVRVRRKHNLLRMRFRSGSGSWDGSEPEERTIAGEEVYQFGR